jgi:predicted DNA-binding antitoxin AbrB/MazE fold protein
VVYEGGVFKPLREVDLHEGTKAFVVLKPERITNVARRYRMKVDRDVMAEFVAEGDDWSRRLSLHRLAL